MLLYLLENMQVGVQVIDIFLSSEMSSEERFATMACQVVSVVLQATREHTPAFYVHAIAYKGRHAIRTLFTLCNMSHLTSE